MTQFIRLTAPKGGQGTSTTAVLLANGFANQGLRTLIVQDIGGDIDALTGSSTLSTGEIRHINDHLSITQGLPSADVASDYPGANSMFDRVILDEVDFGDFAGPTYIVVQPCYMALRRATIQDFGKFEQGVIIVRPQGRALSDQDVSAVLNLPVVASIPMSPDVARASDAGLLARGARHSVSLDQVSA